MKLANLLGLAGREGVLGDRAVVAFITGDEAVGEDEGDLARYLFVVVIVSESS